MDIVFIDIIFITTLGIFSLLGFFNGFIKELFSAGAWIGSIFIAWSYGTLIFPFLSGYGFSEEILPFISFSLLFILSFIILILIGKTVSSMIKMLGLGLIDSLLGGVFGGLKLIVISVTIFILSFNYLEGKSWWDNSCTKSYTIELMSLIDPLIQEWNEGDLVFSKKENVRI